VDRDTIQAAVDAAGPDGRILVRFRDYLVPMLDEAATAVKDALGETVLVHDEAGHERVISGRFLKFAGDHVLLGTPPRTIEEVIPFADIQDVRPDHAEHPSGSVLMGLAAPAPSLPADPPAGEPPAAAEQSVAEETPEPIAPGEA
jgi:hypothetical protein